MSKRKDILDGTKISNLVKKYGLIYTCNCGWVDLGHLNPENQRKEIGATNLWKQINTGGTKAFTYNPHLIPKHLFPLLFPFPLGGSPSLSLVLEEIPDEDKEIPYKFQDGKTGFLVHYRQDHAGYPLKPGREGNYIVKHGLSMEQKKSVALSIFMEVSKRFEDFQKFIGLGGLITDSGYSQEDLVSNLIGFYIAVGEVNRLNILKKCHPVSDKAAFSIWDRDGAVGKNKNTDWKPKYADDVYIETDTQCKVECAKQPKLFPNELQTIKPATKKGLWYVELSPVLLNVLTI